MSECQSDSNSTININHGIIDGALPGVPGPPGPTGYPELTDTLIINDPQVAGRRYLTFANLPSTVTKVVVLHEGTATSSTLNISHGTNFQGVGTALFSSPVTSTSRSTGDHYVSFAPGSTEVAVSSHIWVELSAVSATTDRVIVNITRTALPAATTGAASILIEDSGAGQGYLPVIDAP